ANGFDSAVCVTSADRPVCAATCSLRRSRPGGGGFAPMSRSAALQAMADAELVQMCLEGDAMAWRSLVLRFRRAVRGVPLLMGLQADDADEVFQSTFVELYRALP